MYISNLNNMLLITEHVFPHVFVWRVKEKTPLTKRIRQIHCEWKTKVRSRLRSDQIRSSAYHQIACGATQRFPLKPHLLSTWPRSHAITVRRSSQAGSPERRRGSALMRFFFTEKNEPGWGRNARREGMRLKRWYTEKKWRTDSPDAVISYWFVLWVHCLEHERVLRWSLPDDDLHDAISLPADHVTYKTLCGCYNHKYTAMPSFSCPGCILPPPIYSLTSNLCRHHDLQEPVILTVEHTCGVYAAPAYVH